MTVSLLIRQRLKIHFSLCIWIFELLFQISVSFSTFSHRFSLIGLCTVHGYPCVRDHVCKQLHVTHVAI